MRPERRLRTGAQLQIPQQFAALVRRKNAVDAQSNEQKAVHA
jgi:hypothetical protein